MCLKNNRYKSINVSEHDRKERDEIMRKMQESHNKMMRVLDAFNDKIEMPINRKELEQFPLLEWVKINDLIEVRKRKNLFGSYLNFDTRLKKGGEFGKHFHDDMIESAEIVEGKMLDRLDDSVYDINDIMHYEKGEHHHPIALEDTLLKVIFKP